MMSNTSKAREVYAQRMHRVLDYITEHIDEDLSVEHLSTIASFSKFHFHRQFAAYCGVNLGRYVQLMKLRQACHRLAFHPDHRVIDIALDAGFASPESFSRAFKTVFGQTPRDFRKQAAWETWNDLYRFSIPPRERTETMDVHIIEVAPELVALLEHKGSPSLLNGTIQRFIAWRKQTDLSPVTTSRTYGVPRNDPNKTAPADFRFDICGSIRVPVPDNEFGVRTMTLPGGRCAATRHVGSRDLISDTVYALYGDWLPGSGEQLRDFPVYFEYLNVASETSEHTHQTDVYLPLKS